jgi:hypothetical protein
MLKYYAFLALIVAIALYYVFIRDPCNQLLSTDFSNRHPSYKILSSGASEGSPESVRCHISYRKPDSEQIHEDIWLYQYSKRGWQFAKIIGTRELGPTDGDQVERPASDDRGAPAPF